MAPQDEADAPRGGELEASNTSQKARSSQIRPRKQQALSNEKPTGTKAIEAPKPKQKRPTSVDGKPEGSFRNSSMRPKALLSDGR